MDTQNHHMTSNEDKIPVRQKVGYAMGAMATNVAINSIANLTTLIYNIGLGVSPVMIGIAQGIPRLWDAISDPLIGNFSDNTRSRYGRRIPYIFVGSIAMGITFWLFWMAPRGWDERATFGYLVVMSLLFYTAYTLMEVPRGALGYEMTNDYHERTRIFAYCSFFINVGSLTIPWLYFLANLKIFGDEVNGMRYVGLGLACFLVVSGMICAIVCKEKKLQQARKQEKIKFWDSIVITLRNRTFLWLLAVVFLVTIGFYFVSGFTNYIMIYFVYAGDKAAASVMMGWCGTLWSTLSLIGVFAMTWIATRLGKSKTVMIFLVVMALGNLLKVVCYDPDHPWLVLIPTASLSMGMLVLFSLIYSMMADICDEDELNTGKRREGSYQAIYGLLWKLGIGLAYFAAGALLESTGFDEELTTQAVSTLFWLRFWDIALPSFVCLLGAFLLVRYPLTESRAYEIKKILEERRGNGR